MVHRIVDPTSSPGVQILSREVVDLLRHAEVRVKRGEFALAMDDLNRGLALAPDQPQLLRLQAVALHQQGYFPAAAATWRQVLRSEPNDAAVHNNLGSALGAAGDMSGAVVALRRACELAPIRANYWYNLAKALEGVADARGACVALTQLLELTPEDAKARVLRAGTLKTLGRIKEAAADLRYVLVKYPDSVEAWSSLVNLKTIRLNEDDLAQIKRIHSRPGLREDYRISLGFTYGMALEASHRYAEAFSVLVEANAAKRRHVRWQPSVASRFVDETMHAFAAPQLVPPDSTRGEEVVFLFGMPRSGSTLLEQILCAHPSIEGAGEISDLGVILLEESKRRGTDIPQWAPLASAADWARLGDAYLTRTARWRARRPIFTDKDLGKWQILGAARAMLPGARFIHCRRDTLETCWSCFKHEFKTDQLYSYDFGELATYWHDYDRMMHFWQAQYPGLVHDCVYEDLISHPEAQIRRVLDYCRLPFDPACLRFYEVERNVLTASAAQVRQPLNRHTALSARYGSLLDPLRRTLGLPTWAG